MLAQGLLGEAVAGGLPDTTGSRRTACVGGGRGASRGESAGCMKGGGGVREGQSRSGEGRGHMQEGHQQPSQWQEDISGADSDLQRVAKGTRGPSLELWMPRSQGKQSWTHNSGGQWPAGRERKARPQVRASRVLGRGGDWYLPPDLRSRADFQAWIWKPGKLGTHRGRLFFQPCRAVQEGLGRRRRTD